MQVTKLALVLWTTFISIPWMLKFPGMFAAFLAPAFTAQCGSTFYGALGSLSLL
jgi:hypothetical protein